MARIDINRSAELEMFVRVVERGGFSAAARASGMTPSSVSKTLGRLEARLGARLINRSTRRHQLTAEGQAYYDRAVRILADLDEADRLAGAGDRPAGRVTINSSASYVAHVLAPILPGLLIRFPSVDLDIIQTDTVVDLLAERADIAVRAGPMAASRLMARKLGETRMMIVASPDWISRHGRPRTLADLTAADRIGLGYDRSVRGWPLLDDDGRQILLGPTNRLGVSDGEGVRRLALAGAGVARLARFTIEEDLAAGRICPLLESRNPGDTEAFHAVFLRQSGPLPARLRVVLDYLAEHGRIRA